MRLRLFYICPGRWPPQAAPAPPAAPPSRSSPLRSRVWRTGRGMRSSRTKSRKTTGSVEARTAPPMKAKIQPKFRNSPNGKAPIAMIKPVPGPSISAGTNQRLPNSVTWSLTASRNSTKAKVRVVTTSRNGEWGPRPADRNRGFPIENPAQGRSTGTTREIARPSQTLGRSLLGQRQPLQG